MGKRERRRRRATVVTALAMVATMLGSVAWMTAHGKASGRSGGPSAQAPSRP